MIRVRLAEEPAEFDRRVRMRGKDAIRKRLGQPPIGEKRGKRPKSTYKGILDIPSSEFPEYWTEALPWLNAAYDRTCAYAALRFDGVTSQPTVEHFEPVSRAPSKAYEWSNYRLVCLLLNGRKSDFCDVLDPFEIEDGWFALDLVSGACIAGPAAKGDCRLRVEQTIARLELNGPAYMAAVTDRVNEWIEGLITFEWLKKWAPFVARELVRQGWANSRGAKLTRR